MQYTTKNGERLDVICFKKYGFVNGSVEQVLYEPQNYDLTTIEVFPAGVTFDMPIIKPDETKQEYSLWE